MGQAGAVQEPSPTFAVAFVCAMPMEIRPLVKKLRLEKTELDGVALRSGRLDGRPVAAIVTGMGTELARAAVRRLLDAASVDRVVVVGITGAVDDDTPLGTLVVPASVLDGTTGAAYRPAPLGDIEPHGAMWTSDGLVTSPEALIDVRARGVVSLDMETAAIAEVCEERSVPWSVFRAISDRATDGSVDEAVFRLSHQDGTPNGPAIARFFLRHPGRIPRMARMGRAAGRATVIAASAAIDACSSAPSA